MKCDYEHCTTQMNVPLLTVCIGDTQAGAYWGNYCSYDCAQSEMNQTWEHLKSGKSLSTVVIKNQTAGTVQNTNPAPVANPGNVPNVPAPQPAPPLNVIAPPVAPPAPAPMTEDHNAWGPPQAQVETAAFDEKIAEDVQQATNVCTTLAKKINMTLGSQISESVAELKIKKYLYNTKLFSLKHNYMGQEYDFVIAPFVHGPKEDTVDVIINFPGNDKYNAEVTVKEVVLTEDAITSLAAHVKNAGALIVGGQQEEGVTAEAAVMPNEAGAGGAQPF